MTLAADASYAELRQQCRGIQPVSLKGGSERFYQGLVGQPAGAGTDFLVTTDRPVGNAADGCRSNEIQRLRSDSLRVIADDSALRYDTSGRGRRRWPTIFGAGPLEMRVCLADVLHGNWSARTLVSLGLEENPQPIVVRPDSIRCSGLPRMVGLKSEEHTKHLQSLLKRGGLVL